MGVNGAPELLCFSHSSEYLPLCLNTFIQVWNYLRVSKWQNSFHAHIFICVFVFCHPFLSKCLLWMWKSNLVWIFSVWKKAVCKHDWHNVRSYLFFNVWKFCTGILYSKTFTMAKLSFQHHYSLRSQDPSEILLICWFAEIFLIIINVKNSCELVMLIFLWNPRHIIFRTLWWLESSTRAFIGKRNMYLFIL